VRQSTAWRCYSGNHIYDPCFAAGHGAGFLACPTSFPWVKKVVKLKLTGALPYKFGNGAGPATRGLPWAIQTVDGKSCIALTGAAPIIQSKRLNYSCAGGGGLVGEPHRGASPWWILYTPKRSSTHLTQTKIKSAWF
jgi:hypothetical protein